MRKIEIYRDTFLIFLRGLLMGSADVIPGVSGGTMALITGIYQRLVHAISQINANFLLAALKGDFGKSKEELLKWDFNLFIPLLLGIGLAVLTMSKIMTLMLTVYTATTYAFFFGLILASAGFVYKHVDELNLKNILFLVVGFVFAILFVGLNPVQANHTLPVIFLSGMVAICAMILPGISGAFILLLLNQYEYMLAALNQLKFVDIITFGVGAVIGILSFSRILNYLLPHHKSITMAFLVGLMVGTLRLPYQKITTSMDSVIPVIMAAAIGFILVIVLEKQFEKYHLHWED
jgi:putative membrane protein